MVFGACGWLGRFTVHAVRPVDDADPPRHTHTHPTPHQEKEAKKQRKKDKDKDAKKDKKKHDKKKDKKKHKKKTSRAEPPSDGDDAPVRRAHVPVQLNAEEDYYRRQNEFRVWLKLGKRAAFEVRGRFWGGWWAG